MKKQLICLGAVVALAFGLIGILKRSSLEQSSKAAAPGDVDKQRIMAFWELYNKANSFRLQANFEEAARAYHECLRLDPKHEDSLYYLGASLKELGEYPQAAATFQRMTEVNPTSSRAFSELGATLSLRAPGTPLDFEQARRAFQRSIEINREEAGPFLRLGLLDLDQGRFQEAFGSFRIAAGFGAPEGSFQAGYALFLQKKYREAAAFFGKALESYVRERKISARGVLSEGDVLPTPGKPLTAVEKAGLKSILFLYWVAQRTGGYPEGVPKQFQIRNRLGGAPELVTFAPAGDQAEQAKARACFFDFDGDGALDLLEIGGAGPKPGSLRLFRKVGSRWTEQTQQAGLSSRGTAVACAAGDYNRDGTPDLFVLYWRRDAVLYSNAGGGRFADATEQAGLKRIRGEAFSAVFLDYNRDGLPDLAVGSHAPFEDVVRCLLDPDFRSAQNTPRLFRNKGGGVFEDVTAQVGLNRCYGAMQVLASDLDSDGWPDLVLVNGSLDAQRLEPSVVLRNIQGQEFREWFYMPGFDAPGNFIGARLAAGRIEFVENPVLRAGRAPAVSRMAGRRP